MNIKHIDGFDWDAGNSEKCQKHGVSLAELESAFHHSMSVFPDIAHSQREERFIAIGKTSAGRYVFAAFTLRYQGNKTLIRPISSRYMHTKEVEYYEQAITHSHDR